MKTQIVVAQNFKAPNDGRVGRNVKNLKKDLILNLQNRYTVDSKQNQKSLFNCLRCCPIPFIRPENSCLPTC
jgi:hypothetical protein